MKVAHLVATTSASGVESHLIVLFEALRDVGVEPWLVCPDEGPLTRELAARRFRFELAAPRRRFGWLELGRTARALAGADLVHAHGPRAIWWSASLRARGSVRVPAVATVHEFRLAGGRSAWRRRIYHPIETAALRRQDRLIAVSGALRDRLVASGAFDPRTVRVIHNSTPLLLEALSDPADPAEPGYAFTAARLAPEKGVDLLLRAWRLVLDAGVGLELAIAGTGDARGELERLARALDLGDRVRFLGRLPGIREPLSRSRLYVAPSRSETFGIAVLEAMALGVPVVATAVGGHRDLLAGIEPSPLVAAEDPRALAQAVQSLLARSDEETRALRRRLQARAREAFSPRLLGRRTAEVYTELLGVTAAAGAPPRTGP